MLMYWFIIAFLYLFAGFAFVILTMDLPYAPKKSRFWDYLSRPLSTAGLWKRGTPEGWTILGKSSLGHAILVMVFWSVKLGINLALLAGVVAPHALFEWISPRDEDHPFS